MPVNEIWILGATGRAGRVIAPGPAARQLPLVLVGRDGSRLRDVADTPDGQHRTLVAATTEAMAQHLASGAPAVVVNTIGPFTATALPIVRACPPGTHYLDLSNELSAVTEVPAAHDEAVATGRRLVPGAGFGVPAIESVVLKLCGNRPVPQRVRVDAMAGIEGGVLGPTVAASAVEGLPAGGRRSANGRMVRAGIGSAAEHITLPEVPLSTTRTCAEWSSISALWSDDAARLRCASCPVPEAGARPDPLRSCSRGATGGCRAHSAGGERVQQSHSARPRRVAGPRPQPGRASRIQ
ncbi:MULTISPECIES: hypothetical protein [unclassified Streptomyces]|uniref:hypothetical protein n=1 Tax=unclassified Streptomyces TaxID=2593676 RepID=UPI00131AAA47|nr:hypothetical protein [Streptomyces sp. CB01635]